MKKTFLILLLTISYHLLLAQAPKEYRLRKVVIDAGHGGKDPGAIGTMGYEKVPVLAIALKLGALIESKYKDVQVIYTRKKDEFVELRQRAEIANSRKADLFICIHANACLDKTRFGAETYVMGLHTAEKNMEVAQRENSVIVLEDNYANHYEGYNPKNPESFIAFSLVQNAFLEQSMNFASLIQNDFKTYRKNQGVKQAGFLVLWNTTMPSVLVEVGYLSNPEEQKFIFSEAGQTKYAQSIFNSFCEYKKKVEKESNLTKTSKPRSIEEKPITIQRTEKQVITKKTDAKVFYEVQIGASKTKLAKTAFKGLKEVKETKIDGVFKYSVGHTNSYQEILDLQAVVRKKIPNAFVIAYRNNVKISVQEATKY